MKLINVNTFESEDYGIGLRRSSSQPLIGINSPIKKKALKRAVSSSGRDEEEPTKPQENEEFGRKKLIVRNKKVIVLGGDQVKRLAPIPQVQCLPSTL